jgi:hypothetical protein
VSAAENGEAVPDHPADATAEGPSEIDPDTIKRIAARARRLVRERIRAALDGPVTADPARQPSSDLTDEQLDQIADEEAERAVADTGRGVGALLQVALIHAVSEELGIELEEALDHPALDPTREQLQSNNGAAPDDGDRSPRARAPRQRALLLDAVHVFGIETLEPGDEDIELRLADAGIDVRKPSRAAMIGRLRWDEIRSVSVQRPRRGLPGRRRPALFVAGTDRGEVTFELPGLSDEEITEHLEPLIARNCAGYSDSNAV